MADSLHPLRLKQAGQPARFVGLFALLLALASCAPRAVTPPPVPAPTPAPALDNALTAGVRPGPAFGSLAVSPEAAARALAAFRTSCPVLTRRTDASDLTRPQDWSASCAAAANVPASGALAFFATHFETAVVGDGNAFATGYYEPQILGSRERRPGYAVPVYAKPADLLETNPLTGQQGRGRLDENGNYVLYYERSEIEEGALAGRGLEIAWAADPIDLFFLQIQGSGRLLLPNGEVMRIGYAGQNGREYVAVGRLMRERGLLGTGQTSMQGIVAWLRAHPEEGRAIMRENKSYVFFRELTGPGPIGALNVPVAPRATVAADPKFVPLGAPVVLDLYRQEADGLWVAQDTGGAIRGANRFDTFWGAGEEAARIAGGMQGRGRSYLLLPRGTLDRIRAEGAGGASARP